MIQKATLVVGLLLTIIIVTSWNTGTSPDFDAILKKADFYRGGQVPGITWGVNVQNIEQGKTRNEIGLKVEASTTETQQFALITFLKPKKYDGQRLLLRGNNMWFVKRGLNRPVPISGRQRLSGSASNADVASANYYQDYTIASTEEGAYKETPCWIFNLEAKNNLVSYSGIKYWVSKDQSFGVKAEFYGKSGKLIKTAVFEYENQIIYQSQKSGYISKVTIFDNVNTEDQTILQMSSPEFKEFNNSKFQKSALLD